MAAGRQTGNREVVLGDALQWLRSGATPLAVTDLVFTSLPDESEVREFAPTIEAWKAWFEEAAGCVLAALSPGGVAVFYQTDIRVAGRGQISKSHLVLRAADGVPEVQLVWHKIVHCDAIDQVRHTSPASPGSVKYTHLLCFRRSGAGSEALPFPDGGAVPDIVSRGPKPTWLRNSARCQGANATMVVLRWAKKTLQVRRVVDPFCGAGTVLALGNSLGLDAVGVDLSKKRVRQAQALDAAQLLAKPEKHVVVDDDEEFLS